MNLDFSDFEFKQKLDKDCLFGTPFSPRDILRPIFVSFVHLCKIILNSVFLKDKYLNLVLPEFSTEAGRVSREKEPRESVDRNFEVLKSLGCD